MSTANLIVPSVPFGTVGGAIGAALLNIEPVTGAIFGAVYSGVSCLLFPYNSSNVVEFALRFFASVLAGLGVALAIGGKITFSAAICLSLMITTAQVVVVYLLFAAIIASLCNCRIRFD